MATTPYVPVSFTGEQITQQKLQQMANNDQWLFENGARIRYNASGVLRDTQVKIIAGKTPYPSVGTAEEVNISVYFGSFFTASCKPVVATSSENQLHQAIIVQINGLNESGEVDYRGFNAHVQDRTNGWGVRQSGWVHWIAVGY